jgi:hypothetical protein
VTASVMPAVALSPVAKVMLTNQTLTLCLYVSVSRGSADF